MPPPRCLVIDPDPQFAYLLAGIVSCHGLDVTIAGDPFPALRMLRLEPFDVVLYHVSSDSVDHDFVLETLQRDLPAILEKTVVVATLPIDSSRVPAGVPVIGNIDLKPMMDYLTRDR
ncbi:MAG TPA: hypothetical protein VNA04_18310 [Thermoanaerobaculia bacterium]|nr:hypothetical protein [Thermoanaerobaculia bacterium]